MNTITRPHFLPRLDQLVNRIYVGTVVCKKSGLPAHSPVQYHATRESAVKSARFCKRMGFRLTLRVRALEW